jgi:hypothetical protein
MCGAKEKLKMDDELISTDPVLQVLPAYNAFCLTRRVRNLAAALFLLPSLAPAADTGNEALRQMADDVGTTMEQAGFARASTIDAGTNRLMAQYSLLDDVLHINSVERSTPILRREIRRLLPRANDRNLLLAAAAHEHCHASLYKQPDDGRIAAVRGHCPAVPEYDSEKLFDEAFCDTVAMRVMGGKPAEALLALRKGKVFTQTSVTRDMASRLTVIAAQLLTRNGNPKDDALDAMSRACTVANAQDWGEEAARMNAGRIMADYTRRGFGKAPVVETAPGLLVSFDRFRWVLAVSPLGAITSTERTVLAKASESAGQNSTLMALRILAGGAFCRASLETGRAMGLRKIRAAQKACAPFGEDFNNAFCFAALPSWWEQDTYMGLTGYRLPAVTRMVERAGLRGKSSAQIGTRMQAMCEGQARTSGKASREVATKGRQIP